MTIIQNELNGLCTRRSIGENGEEEENKKKGKKTIEIQSGLCQTLFSVECIVTNHWGERIKVIVNERKSDCESRHSSLPQFASYPLSQEDYTQFCT